MNCVHSRPRKGVASARRRGQAPRCFDTQLHLSGELVLSTSQKPLLMRMVAISVLAMHLRCELGSAHSSRATAHLLRWDDPTPRVTFYRDTNTCHGGRALEYIVRTRDARAGMLLNHPCLVECATDRSDTGDPQSRPENAAHPCMHACRDHPMGHRMPRCLDPAEVVPRGFAAASAFFRAGSLHTRWPISCSSVSMHARVGLWHAMRRGDRCRRPYKADIRSQADLTDIAKCAGGPIPQSYEQNEDDISSSVSEQPHVPGDIESLNVFISDRFTPYRCLSRQTLDLNTCSNGASSDVLKHD